MTAAPYIPHKIINPPTGPSPTQVVRDRAKLHYKNESTLEQVMGDPELDGQQTLEALALLKVVGLHKD
jgi:hypothetical protein